MIQYKFSTYSLLKVLTILLIITTKISSKECEDDEICTPISECKSLLKFTRDPLMRRYVGGKFCGIMLHSTEYCCNTTEEANEKLQESTTELNFDYEEETSSVKHEIDLQNHKNLKLINHKLCGLTDECTVMYGELVCIQLIVSGKEAERHQFPWMALLEYESVLNKVKKFLCAGTLISNRYVLTAAHCLNSPKNRLVSVRLGEHRLSQGSKVEDIAAESFVVHEGYNIKTKQNDIGLIRLSRDVVFEEYQIHIKTVCLPFIDSHQIDDQSKLQIAGWGFTEFSRKLSDVLMTAEVPYISNENCIKTFKELSKKYPTLDLNITDSQMCAGGVNKTDTCKGDSGGGLFLRIFHHGIPKGITYQHGIVSYGISCGDMEIPESFPGVYTRVSEYIEWILDNIYE